MKTVVVTGSARGFGYEFVRLFRKRDYNVVVCDISKTALKEAKNNLLEISSRGKVLTYEVDQISIVLPNQTEELLVVDGEDYCTLMTCTPYGVNTHRLLVKNYSV